MVLGKYQLKISDGMMDMNKDGQMDGHTVEDASVNRSQRDNDTDS